MDIHQILKKLPHRYPFLLVDRVLELEHGKRIKALKNVTINEPYFVGHFPHRPVMPGVLMLEALAQAAALLVLRRRSAPSPTTTRSTTSPASTARASSARSSRATSSILDVDARPHEGRHLQVQAPGPRSASELAVEAELMCTMRTHRLTARDAHGDDPPDGHRRARRRARRRRSRSVPTRIVAPHVRIGDGTTIGPHCVIEGHTTIGRDNRIFQFVLDRRGRRRTRSTPASRPSCEIGDRNTIREFCTFNLGTVAGRGRDARSATTTGSWPTCTSRTTASVGNQTILANNADARRPRAPGRLGDRRRADAACTSSSRSARMRWSASPARVLAGRAAVHDGRRQPAGGARLQRRGPAPARLQRRAHRRGQADAPPALPRGPHASTRRAPRIAALADEPARGRGRRRS